MPRTPKTSAIVGARSRRSARAATRTPAGPAPFGKRTIERHVHARLVDVDVVADPAALEELLAVVGGHDHDRLLPEALGLERPAQRADLLVGEGEVPVVEPHEVLALRLAERPAALVHVREERLASRRSAFGIGPSGPNFVSKGGSGSYGKCGSRKWT